MDHCSVVEQLARYPEVAGSIPNKTLLRTFKIVRNDIAMYPWKKWPYTDPGWIHGYGFGDS